MGDSDRIPSLPELKLIAVDPSRAGLEGPRMSYMGAHQHVAHFG